MGNSRETADKQTKAPRGLQPDDFVHLHNHTQYSLLDGLTKVPALMDHVQQMGMKSVTITDHGTLSGAIEFYKEANARKLKPIIGMEAYVAPRSHTDRDPAKDKQPYHLILLAMNNTGYKNMMRLSTIANLQGFYYKPRVDRDLLEQYNEGLIVLSGCIGGEVGDALRQDQYAKAKETAAWYQRVFGDRYYLEIQDHGHEKHPSKWDEQVAVNKQLFRLSEELKIPCAVTADAHYLKHEDQEAHEALLCVQTGSFMSDSKRMTLKNLELHVSDPKDIIKRWGKDHPEVITNTGAIAKRCNVELELGKILIPKFPVPAGETEKSYLHKSVYRGLAWRYGNQSETHAAAMDEESARATLSADIRQRAEYELRVIDSMGFNGYFLIISDFIGWGKAQGIVFGPGRGSAAGSIISYALNITELDPLAYDLLFERFLNPDRISMPDIDIDIQDNRRDEVIQYCVDKYGKDRVANIVTFGRMAARNAVRDVARVLQVPYADADRLAKMIPPPVQGRHIPLATSLQEDVDLKREYESNEQSKRVFDLAMQLEGTIRSHGVHAAGVVIAPDEIVKFVPLEMAQKGVVATQYSMGPIEELGLLKMDFLGLSNLTIIKNALRIIKKVYGQNIDISQLPLDDKETFELFQNGDTTGVFQFESAGMKRYLKELKPTVFDDLIAMNALYRPGPMQWIDDFIARKHGKKAIEYLHEKTKNALENTYGILVYQEQVMQIAKDLCGFTGGQADTLRKGVAKKKPEVLAALKKDFINGALQNSDISRGKIDEFWRSLEAFAAYCFPKAHSSCYATIAYWTAYLKANHPAAFMAALMTSDYDDTDRLAIEINECKHMGITVLPPDVNQSFMEFAVVPGARQIRFGLNAVKNVGSAAVEEILRAREEKGRFESLEDFLGKVNVRVVNRKTLESLIKAGAFDSFGDRSLLLNNIDVLLAYANRVQKELSSGQTDLFGNQLDNTVSRPRLVLASGGTAYNVSEQLQWERELLGIYLSQHPLDMYKTVLEEQTVPLDQLKPDLDGRMVTIGGTITDQREITTKNGQKMAFVKIADLSGEIEAILFPSIYQQTTGIWERDRVIVAKGKLNAKDREGNATGEVKILIEDAREITHDQAQAYQSTGKKVRLPKPAKKASASAPKVAELSAAPRRVYIRLDSSNDHDLLLRLKQTIDDCNGHTEVVLVLGNTQQKQIIKLPMRVRDDESSLTRIQGLVGAANVKLQ
jgi:DNA polymerase-3 subunit alpha